MAHTPTFNHLPEELLTAIIENLWTEDRQCVSETLFGGIRLLATSEHLEHLAQVDINRISPFVDTVTFAVPFSSWSLTFEKFREVIVSQAIQKYQDVHRPPNPKFKSSNNHKHFIEQHWNGEFPLSDDKIRAGFEDYQDQAQAMKYFLLDERLREAWAGALRALRDVHKFCFTTVDCEKTGSSHLPVQPDCIVRPHRHDMFLSHKRDVCRRAAAPVGDALFAAGVACLAKANVTIHKFNVVCEMTGQFGWQALPGWGELDLSQLPSFTFQPKVQMMPYSRNYPGDQLETADRAADAVAAVLRKSKDSLEHFKYQNSCNMAWPGNEVIHLPKLRTLSLGDGCIRAHNLATWMAHMPSLEVFKLKRTGLLYRPNRDWLFVLDAIRNHPRGLNINFWHTIENDCLETVCLRYRTDKVEDWLALPEEERTNGYVHSDPDWPLYLSGKIEYNNFMQDWLRDH
ncbi:MAG: hypothetical protein M1836_004143 [Candelina mexicana]|nr:MAG: hypothetical protein M1836_004143 [Candelina mexicana]